MALNNTLYPPIMDTYMPAIVLDDFRNRRASLVINFAISNFTSLANIKEVQIQIKTQDGEKNVIRDSGFLFIPISFTENYNRTYSIEIDYDASKFVQNVLKEDEFYRIQIRFSSTAITPGANQTKYLNENADKFSEWSSISLVKMIYGSGVVFTKGLSSKTNRISYVSSFEELTGYLGFETGSTDTTEYLYSYRVRIYENSDLNLENLIETQPLEDTGQIMAASYNPNQFSLLFTYDFNTGDVYRIVFDYITSNNYTKTQEFSFMIIESKATSVIENYIDWDNGGIELIPNYEKGCIQLHIKFARPYSGKIVIRRADGRSNYKYLEDLYFDSITIRKNEQNYIKEYFYEDYTVESGMLYRYVIQDRDSLENRGKKVYCNQKITNDENNVIGYVPVMVELDDMFISNYGNTLKIKFDPTVDSYQPVVMDNKVETIGSKYPFMKRGAAVNYKTFSIGGTISWEGDIFEDIANNDLTSLLQHSKNESFDFPSYDVDFARHLFAGIGELFTSDAVANEYRNLKGDNYNNHQDFTIERLFREAVLEYLTDGEVKLFRSPSEGNILIKLTDVSLSPKQELGRLLYTLSATATEIDECTIDNYVLYDIFRNNRDGRSNANSYIISEYHVGDNISKYNTFEQYTYAPLQGEYTFDFMKYLDNKYGNIQGSIQTILEKITYVKLDFADYVEKSLKNIENIVALVKVNGKEMYVSTSYPYLEIEDVNIKTLTITTYNNTSSEILEHIIIDYKGVVNRNEIFLHSADIAIDDNNIAQIRRRIETGTSLIPILYDKHTFASNKYTQSLLSINKIIIQTNPKKDICFLIRDTSTLESVKTDDDTDRVDFTYEDSEPFQHLTDSNGLLELYDENSIFQTIIYNGIRAYDYAVDDNNYLSFDVINTPEEKTIYNVWTSGIIASSVNGEEGVAIVNGKIVGGDTLEIGVDQLIYDQYTYIDGEWYPVIDGFVNYPIDLTLTYFYTVERSEII